MEQEKDFIQIMLLGLSKAIKKLPFGEKASDKLEEKALERESEKLEKKAEKLEKKATKEEYKIALIEKNKALKEKNEALKEKIDKLRVTAEELKKDIKEIKENENSKDSMREKYGERFGIDVKALKEEIKEEIKKEILQETSKAKEMPKEQKGLKENLEEEIKKENFKEASKEEIKKEKEMPKENSQEPSKKEAINYYDLKNTGAELSYTIVSKDELNKIKEKLDIDFSYFATENKDKINLAVKKDDFGKVSDLLNDLRKDITEEVLSHIGDGKVLGDIDGMNKEDGFKIYSKLKSLESKGLVQFSGNPDNLSKQKVKVTENGKKLLNQIEKYKENNKGKSPSKITISKMINGINGMDKGNMNRGVDKGR